MKGSVTIARIRGIGVRVHLTFLLLLAWAAAGGWLGRPGGLCGAAFGLAFTLLLFVCVVLHELAHSLTALHFGAEVHGITLLPIGGLAQVDRIPERPLPEFLIAVAGPAVNLVLAGLLVLPVWAALPERAFLNLSFLPLFIEIGPWWQKLAGQLLIANVWLAAFNLLPAFPMDGGRVLRALLALRLSHVRATQIAVGIGQGIALLLGFVGLVTLLLLGWGGGGWLLLIALFVFTGAAYEGRSTQVRSVLRDVRVEQVLGHEAPTIQPTEPLSQALELALRGHQADLAVVSAGQLVGLLGQRALLAGLRHHGPEAPVSQVMLTLFPTATPADSLAQVQEQMARSGLEAIPVVEGDAFRGLVTLGQINQVYTVLSSMRRPPAHDTAP